MHKSYLSDDFLQKIERWSSAFSDLLGLKQVLSEYNDLHELFKVRILIFFVAISTSSFIGYMFFYAWIGAYWSLFFCLFPNFFILPAIYIFIKKRYPVTLMALWLSFCIVTSAVCMSLTTGGIQSVHLFWLLVMVLCVYLLANNRWGHIMSAYVIVQILVVWFLDSQLQDRFYELQGLDPLLYRIFHYVIISMTLSIIYLMFILIHEREQRLLFDAEIQAVLAEKRKDNFLSIMSHEIRTPMNGVIGMTQLLLDSTGNKEQRAMLEIVQSNGESLISLINDILDFTKIEEGKLELDQHVFDLERTLESFFAAHIIRAEEKGLNVMCGSLPNVPLYIVGDASRLKQILNNLVGNAIKFTEKGEVSVLVSRDIFCPHPQKVLLRFTIRDTGLGIPENRKSALFQQFSQVDASTSRRYGGTGLGLAISKQLAELMGGEIGVNSEEGQGSEFWFTALFSVPEVCEIAAELPSQEHLSGARVLLLEEHATLREFLSAHFSSWGMKVDRVDHEANVIEALVKAHELQNPYTFLLLKTPSMMDVSLDILRKIREKSTLQSLKIILIVPFESKANIKNLPQGLADGHVLKPFRIGELREKMLDILSADLTDDAEENASPTLVEALDRERRFSDRHTRILLVEDNRVNQQVCMGLLSKIGMRADTAMNGQEALERMQQQDYDLVLMDCQMPVMDGYETTRIIRDQEDRVAHKNLPIIALTANAMQGDREKCLQAGMTDYLTKPLKKEALIRVLDQWLPHSDI